MYADTKQREVQFVAIALQYRRGYSREEMHLQARQQWQCQAMHPAQSQEDCQYLSYHARLVYRQGLQWPWNLQELGLGQCQARAVGLLVLG